MREKHLRWGILSCARIARQKVIPAIQNSQFGSAVAIASRNCNTARQVAQEHEIPAVCPTYDDLIHLETIDAVYIPLPNHLHVEWACKAIKAGKHVLCEKPLGLNESDVLRLQSVSGQHPRQLVAEAFMYRHHPQWIHVHKFVHSGEIGRLQSIHTHFSYSNLNAGNIRNKPEFGGGALMDIGCYGISVARWLYGTEPTRVCARMERHPEFRTDTSASILLDFPRGSATITCGTKMQRSQSVMITGSSGRIVLHSPFAVLPDESASLELERDTDSIIHEIAPANQFSEQFDTFASAVCGEACFSTPVADSLRNMRVIDACFRSAEERAWITC